MAAAVAVVAAAEAVGEGGGAYRRRRMATPSSLLSVQTGAAVRPPRHRSNARAALSCSQLRMG